MHSMKLPYFFCLLTCFVVLLLYTVSYLGQKTIHQSFANCLVIMGSYIKRRLNDIMQEVLFSNNTPCIAQRFRLPDSGGSIARSK